MKASSKAILFTALLGAFGGWFVSLGSTWAAATTPAAVGGLCLVLGSTLGAAFGVKSDGVK
jgi:hypothetical protein